MDGKKLRMTENKVITINPEAHQINSEYPVEILKFGMDITKLELIGTNLYVLIYPDGILEIGVQDFDTSKFDNFIKDLENA